MFVRVAPHRYDAMTLQSSPMPVLFPRLLLLEDTVFAVPVDPLEPSCPGQYPGVQPVGRERDGVRVRPAALLPAGPVRAHPGHGGGARGGAGQAHGVRAHVEGRRDVKPNAEIAGACAF